MSSLQGQLMRPNNSRYPVDYYGKPEYREMLMRFDFAQEIRFQSIDRTVMTSARWSEKYPGNRTLGIAPSGKFAIYLMTWIPQYIRSREDICLKLIRCVPPTDRFLLNFLDSFEWRREQVKIPFVLPTAKSVIELNQNIHNEYHSRP